MKKTLNPLWALLLVLCLACVPANAEESTDSQKSAPILSQEPLRPYNYKVEDVSFGNADSSITFGATLTIPPEAKRHPVILIVPGTGKHDRDGTMAGHKMFLVLADYLTRNGIAVLRVDKRGVGKTTGSYEDATTGDFADDAMAGIQYLKTRKEIDPRRIGLLGHSEGGLIISKVVARSKDVAFIVSVAGLAMNGLDALKMQNEELVANSRLAEYDKKRSREINNLMFDLVYANADSPDLAQKIEAAYSEWKKKDDAYFKTLNLEFDHFRFPIYSYTQTAIGKWYRYFVKNDAQADLQKVRVPILAINGDRDLMVTWKENLSNWAKYPAVNGNTKVKTVVLPGINHLMQKCTTCTQSEYSQLSETFSPDALKMITAWIRQQCHM